MTCKCLTSDWLTALSSTVINPIKLPERRERETRETETQRRQTETETDETETETEREREREASSPVILDRDHGTAAIPAVPRERMNEWPGYQGYRGQGNLGPTKTDCAQRGGCWVMLRRGYQFVDIFI